MRTQHRATKSYREAKDRHRNQLSFRQTHAAQADKDAELRNKRNKSQIRRVRKSGLGYQGVSNTECIRQRKAEGASISERKEGHAVITDSYCYDLTDWMRSTVDVIKDQKDRYGAHSSVLNTYRRRYNRDAENLITELCSEV